MTDCLETRYTTQRISCTDEYINLGKNFFSYGDSIVHEENKDVFAFKRLGVYQVDADVILYNTENKLNLVLLSLFNTETRNCVVGLT